MHGLVEQQQKLHAGARNERAARQLCLRVLADASLRSTVMERDNLPNLSAI